MNGRRNLLWFLLLTLLIGPIASATIVPDPTWIGGLYDGGDGDEVAILWEHTPGIVPVVTVPLVPASRLYTGEPAPLAFVSRPLPRFTSRAPPQA
jgi:hypothetical protein